MFEQVWKKYLPVIKILLKQAKEEEKKLQLNKIDFEKALLLKKSSLRFTIEMVNGKVENIVSDSVLATALISVFQESESALEILTQGSFTIKMNNKYQLLIAAKD